MEYFAFPVNDILLKVESHVFGNAEILHVVGHSNPQLAAYSEEMVDACLTCEHHCSKIKHIDFLMAEIFCRDSLNLYEWFKVYFQVVFFSQVEIWRFRIHRFWLRH